jgi:hypothetical protein
MDDYCDAREFYMNRSWSRRIEFRRRQKKFLINIKEKIDLYLDNEEDESKQEDIELDMGSDVI